MYLDEVTLSVSDELNIASWMITGFSGTINSTGEDVTIKRMGERLSVAGEEIHLSNEQKQRDIHEAEWRKRAEEYMKEVKAAKIGQDVEGARGAVAMLPNTGTHQWVLRWNHIPARGGSCDGFGLVGEACENYGSASSPLFGGADSGVSLGIYADGKVYHNGKIINQIKGKSGNESLLFTKGSLIYATFNTDLDGGTFTFQVNREDNGVVVSGVYELLGDKEVFPCLCMCPFDVVEEVIPLPLPTQAAGENASPPATSDPPAEAAPKKPDVPFPYVHLYLDIEKLNKMAASSAGNSTGEIIDVEVMEDPHDAAPASSDPEAGETGEAPPDGVASEEQTVEAVQAPKILKATEIPVEKIRW